MPNNQRLKLVKRFVLCLLVAIFSWTFLEAAEIGIGRPGGMTIPVDTILIWLVTGIASVVFAVLGFLLVRTLSLIDRSQFRTTQIQDKLFDKLETLCEEFYVLKGEHRSRKHSRCTDTDKD